MKKILLSMVSLFVLLAVSHAKSKAPNLIPPEKTTVYLVFDGSGEEGFVVNGIRYTEAGRFSFYNSSIRYEIEKGLMKKKFKLTYSLDSADLVLDTKCEYGYGEEFSEVSFVLYDNETKAEYGSYKHFCRDGGMALHDMFEAVKHAMKSLPGK